MASQTRVQQEAYKMAEERRYKKVNHKKTSSIYTSKMFSSTEIPDSLKCPACKLLMSAPQKMTPCGCIVCLDCTDSVILAQTEAKECPFCKKEISEDDKPDYINDEDAQARLQSHLSPGSPATSVDSAEDTSSSGNSTEDPSSADNSSGDNSSAMVTSSDDSQAETSSSAESSVAALAEDAELDNEVRAPKRKAAKYSEQLLPPPDTCQRIEVLGTAKPEPQVISRHHHHQEPHHQEQRQQSLGFDPLAAFNEFLKNKDKRDKYAKGFVEASNRRREAYRHERRRHFDYEGHSRDYYRKPYYRR